MARALAAAIVVSLAAVSGAGGSGAQAPQRGGKVVIAETTNFEPACLNGFVDACTRTLSIVSRLTLVLDGACEVEPDATFRPNLVSHAEIVSRLPFTLVYHIRPEARWSDGVRHDRSRSQDSAGCGSRASPATCGWNPGSVLSRSELAERRHPDRRGRPPRLEGPVVRQTLTDGIDRVEIARAIEKLSGASETASEPLDSVVFLRNSPYYQPNWKGYRHRPALARRLLEQAGCRRGDDGIYSCAGERLSLRLATVAGVAVRERTVELAQAQLRRVGVEVTPVYARPAIFGDILSSGDFDFALFAWIRGASTSGPFDVFGCQGANNFTGYCSRLVTRDLDQATRTVDDKRRVGLLNKVDARLAKAVPAIPLFQQLGLFALKTTVRGVVPNAAGFFIWNAGGLVAGALILGARPDPLADARCTTVPTRHLFGGVRKRSSSRFSPVLARTADMAFLTHHLSSCLLACLHGAVLDPARRRARPPGQGSRCDPRS